MPDSMGQASRQDLFDRRIGTLEIKTDELIDAAIQGHLITERRKDAPARLAVCSL